MRPKRRRRARITTDADAAIPDGADDDAEEPETGPLRRCAVTRERLPKERMIRFVVGPGRELAPDLAGRLPGRGIWLSARRDVLETGRRPERPDAGIAPRGSPKLAGFFARAARGPVTLPDDLPGVLRIGLERRIGELLGLARRAGQAVSGFEKAREWIKAGRAGLIVQASDGSPAERARCVPPETAARLGLAVVTPLDATTLGLVFGRERAVHVAVAQGKLAVALGHEARRLAGILGLEPADPSDATADGVTDDDVTDDDASDDDATAGDAGLDKIGAGTNSTPAEMGKTHI